MSSVSSTAAEAAQWSSSTGSDSSRDLLLLYFHYHPSVAAAIVAAVAFAVISLPLTGLSWRTGMRLSWILVGTALAEAIGYVLRAVTVHHVALGPFLVTELLLLLAPNALALLNYKVLGQVIDRKSPPPSAGLPPPTCRIPFLMDERGLIRGRRVAYIFFTSDVIGFLIQGGGGGQEASSDPSTQKLGAKVIMGGLVFQVIFFALFAALAVYVYCSPLYNQPSSSEQQVEERTRADKQRMVRVFFALFVTILLILLRNVYRLIEFAVTPGSYIPSTEWLFYVFDFVPIFLAMVVYARWHFGLYLPAQQLVVAPVEQQHDKQAIQLTGAELA